MSSHGQSAFAPRSISPIWVKERSVRPPISCRLPCHRDRTQPLCGACSPLPTQIRVPATPLPQREHLGGLEPPTFPLGGGCPVHLGHRPIRDAGRGRTGNDGFAGHLPHRREPRQGTLGPIRTGDPSSGTRCAIPCATRAWWQVQDSNLGNPGGVTVLQTARLAARATCRGVTSQVRTGNLRDHSPAL